MKLLEALKHAARFSVTPTYSLFAISATGSGELLLKTSKAEEIVERFLEECRKPYTGGGLEVRCEGMRVEFNGV